MLECCQGSTSPLWPSFSLALWRLPIGYVRVHSGDLSVDVELIRMHLQTTHEWGGSSCSCFASGRQVSIPLGQDVQNTDAGL